MHHTKQLLAHIILYLRIHLMSSKHGADRSWQVRAFTTLRTSIVRGEHCYCFIQAMSPSHQIECCTRSECSQSAGPAYYSICSRFHSQFHSRRRASICIYAQNVMDRLRRGWGRAGEERGLYSHRSLTGARLRSSAKTTDAEARTKRGSFADRWRWLTYLCRLFISK
jgi:hypothetical protein